ncbi:MAG: peptidoglycan -binding protein [Pseudomonadota bacterium]
MALSRRAGGRVQSSIWPGFVDAMTGLLLVLMFVLTIFIVVQFVLRDQITRQSDEVLLLEGQVAALSQALGLERNANRDLSQRVDDLGLALDDASSQVRSQAALIASLSAQRDEKDAALSAAQIEIASFEEQVASLLAQQAENEASIVALTGERDAGAAEIAELLTREEQLNLALAAARDEIDAQQVAARRADAERAVLEALVADLRNEAAAREASLAQLATQLETETDARAQLAAALSAIEREKASVDAQLAAALSSLTQSQSTTASLTESLAALRDTLAQSEEARQAEAARAAEQALRIGALQESVAAEATARDSALADAAAVRAALEAALAQISEEEQARLAQAATLLALQQQLQSTEAELSAEQQAALAEQATVAALQARLAEAEATLAEEERAKLAEAAAAQALRESLAETQGELSEEEEARLAAAAAAVALRARLSQAQDELSAMALQLEARRQEAEDTLTLLAAANADIDEINARLAAALAARADADARVVSLEEALAQTTAARAEAGQTLESLRDQLAAALAAQLAAEGEAARQLTEVERRDALLSAANERLEQEEALSADSQRTVEVLNLRVAELQEDVRILRGLLDDFEDKSADSDAQIVNMGRDLNAALALVAQEQKRAAEEAERRLAAEEALRAELESRAADLERAQSTFLAGVRDALEGQEGVRLVGDRFVFSSEVLFPPGGAELSDGGRAQIARIAQTLRDAAAEIPGEIDWVLQVDGHTDNIPLSGFGEFANNWELSQARALSVVLYMVNFLGFDPERLSANGFGEYQPLNVFNTATARAQNRRIELKFTEK